MICIKEWSDVTNTCPLCKKEFFEIQTKYGEVIKVQAKKQRSDHYEDSDELEDSILCKK